MKVQHTHTRVHVQISARTFGTFMYSCLIPHKLTPTR